jgi:D-arabinose 1-dehydrogenase-like Zn-dependent alcohol dehydrogenase
MKAMAVARYGDPLELVELPDPEPHPGQALIKVLTCGVCSTDLKIVGGTMRFSHELSLPHVPGHEVFGEVVATNPDGLIEPGTRAIVYQYWSCGRCAACRRGHDALCTDLEGWLGFTHPGGLREHVVAPVERLIPVPPGIAPVDAAPLSCAMGTAYRSVVTRGGVTAGTTVGVIGLGGVGIHAVQIAAAVGATVIGFDVHEPTLEAARELGIESHRADEEPRDGNGTRADDGLDVVIETVATEASWRLANRLTRRGGRIVAVGHTPTLSIELPATRVVLDELEIVGTRYATREEMARGVAMVADGLVRPMVGLVRPLEQANEVLDALAAAGIVGRAVLDVAGAT